MSVRRDERDENGTVPSYYVSTGSNARAMRPGQPVGRQAHQLQIDPTREWVRRNAPATKFDADSDNFFHGTGIVRSVGKDEGLSGVRCMTVVNNRVWIGEREGCYSVWDFHSGDRIFRSTKKKDIFVWSILGPVTGSLVWVGSSDAFIRVFHGETMELVKEMKEHSGGVYALADTPGGRLVFSGSSDFTIVKWDGMKMERSCTLTGHKNNVRSLIVVGKRLFSGSDDHSIRIWDIQTNAHLGSLEDHTGGVHALTYSKHLWSASEDKTIRVWNPDNVDQPIVKVLKQPHNGQINCLSLTGSLIWSSSWNVTYVWDPESFECKAQYKHHEGCINAMIPVHQAVVSRVWSASNDGVINLWNTECTYRRALSASSDGRLEEALLQLDESNEKLDAGKKKIHEMEQICLQLQGEKDRSQMLMDSQKDKYEQQAKEQRRQHQEAAQRNMELKERLEHLGSSSSAASPYNTAELIAAYQLGMEPNSVMPADYEDDDFLDQGERDRREKLRDAFLKGKENAGKPNEPDDLEARLRRALERAYQVGDPVAAEFLREWLDNTFPSWRETAAKPIMPITYLEEGSLSPDEGKRRGQLRKHFLDGLTDGGQDKAPVQPVDVLPTSDEMEHWRNARDAFLAGKDASRVLPEHLNNPETKTAFAKGLGSTRGVVPEEYRHDKDASENENLKRFSQRTAFLKGRYAASKIPRSLDDNDKEGLEARERKRRLREHFLHGLNIHKADLPMEYRDQPSDLTTALQSRRETSRDAFRKGQGVTPLIPGEFSEGEVDDIQPAVKTLRTELREAFLDGFGQEDMPACDGPVDIYNKQMLEAYKKGWLVSCPFAMEEIASPVREGRGNSVSPLLSPALSGAGTGDALAREGEKTDMRDLLDRIKDLEDANRDLGIERDQAEDTLRKALDDIEQLRDELDKADAENARLRAAMEGAAVDDADLPRHPARRRQSSTPQPPSREQSPHSKPQTPHQVGGSPANQSAGTPHQGQSGTPQLLASESALTPQLRNDAVEGNLDAMRAFHANRVTVGGTMIRAIPPVSELSQDDVQRLKDMEDVYGFRPAQEDDEGDINLPRLYDMTPQDADFIRQLMSRSPTIAPKSPSHLADGVQVLLDERKDLPEEVRDELLELVEDERYNARQPTPEAVRATVEELDDALPAEIREDLLEKVKTTNDSTVGVLEDIFERAKERPDVPRNTRKALDELLMSKDIPSPEEYAAQLRQQARSMVADEDVPDDVRSELRRALGQDDDNVKTLFEQVKSVVHDTSLPLQTRLALNDAVSPARTDEVPEAVRQVLRDGGLPANTEYNLREALMGHDNREDELKRAVQGNRNVAKTQDPSDLAAAVRKAARNPNLDPSEHRTLQRLYNAFEGRTATVEDGARGLLHDLKTPEAAREKLRNALLKSGVDRDDLVADAVRYAVANDDVPADTNSNLRSGLTEFESRQGDLCSAVRKALRDGVTNTELKEALDACEDRSTQMSASLSAESKDQDVAEAVAKALKSLVSGTRRRHSSLQETASLAAGREDIPVAVRNELSELVEAHSDEEARSAALAQRLFEGAGLETEEPSAVVAMMRETLLDADMAQKDRNDINAVVERSDEAFAILRDAVRRHGLNSEVPADVRKQLRAAACESDSAADVLNAGVRVIAVDHELLPATRSTLNTAAFLSNQKYETLYDAARAQSGSGDLTERQRKGLKGATAEASGKPQEMYRTARAAAHNPDVPHDVRKVLLEALGEKSSAEVAGEAVAALFENEVKDEQSRQQLEDALKKEDAAAAELKEVVQEVLRTCDLSDSMHGNLADATAGVEQTDQQLLEVVEDKGLDSQTRATFQGANSNNVSELVRSALQQAGIPDKGSLLTDQHESRTRLEEEVRKAVSRGDLPEEAQQKLMAALREKDQTTLNLREVTLRTVQDPLIKKAEEMLATDDLPESRRREIEDALEDFKERDVVLQEESREIAHRADGGSRSKLSSCGSVQDLEELLDEGDLDEDTEVQLRDHLHRYHGKRDILEEALDEAQPVLQEKEQASHMPAVKEALEKMQLDEKTRTILQDAVQHREGTPEHRPEEDDRHHLQEDRDRFHEEADRFVDPHGHVGNEGFGHSNDDYGTREESRDPSRDRVELHGRSDRDEQSYESHHSLHSRHSHQSRPQSSTGGGRADLHETSDTYHQSNVREGSRGSGYDRHDGRPQEAATFDVNADKLAELQRIVDRLGGVDEARRLSNQVADLHKLDADRLRKEQELADLRAMIDDASHASYTQATNAETAPLTSATKEVKLDERQEALRNAYQGGRKANVKSPLPVDYRSQLSDDEDDKEFRRELTDAWLKGRQEAIGSVVPPEFAEVTGLPDDETDVRSSLREAFLDGLGRGEDMVSNNALIQDAVNKGRTQRAAELRRAGTSDEDPASEGVRGFTHGVKGSSPADIDAVLSRTNIPEEDVEVAGRLYGRGRWLRNDVLGQQQEERPEKLDMVAADKTRLAQLMDELEEWKSACDPALVRQMGVAVASPHYVKVLQREIRLQKQDLDAIKRQFLDEQDALREKERGMNDEHQRAMGQLARERALEVDRLKEVLSQMESDLTAKGHAQNSLHNKIERLTEQLGQSGAEIEALTQELIKKATVGDVTELVTYYKERERKWNELSHLNRELQAENKTLMTESTALAHKLRALSFVFESRPTLVRSLYELHKLLSHIPQTLHTFGKHAKQRQLPRLEILDEIREVGSEVDTCKDGTRWIIANLFTAYELQHLGTSPQFFIPDGRRPTWRDIQVPTKQRELLLSTWAEETHDASPPKRDNSPGAQRLQRACRERPHAVGRKRV